jgi:hypothetical protein
MCTRMRLGAFQDLVSVSQSINVNAKAKGTRAEHRSIRLLEAAGYACTRAAASLGTWDIIGVGSTDFALVQVNTRHRTEAHRAGGCLWAAAESRSAHAVHPLGTGAGVPPSAPSRARKGLAQFNMLVYVPIADSISLRAGLALNR